MPLQQKATPERQSCRTAAHSAALHPHHQRQSDRTRALLNHNTRTAKTSMPRPCPLPRSLSPGNSSRTSTSAAGSTFICKDTPPLQQPKDAASRPVGSLGAKETAEKKGDDEDKTEINNPLRDNPVSPQQCRPQRRPACLHAHSNRSFASTKTLRRHSTTQLLYHGTTDPNDVGSIPSWFPFTDKNKDAF